MSGVSTGVFGTFAELLDENPDLAIITIDIPIGLTLAGPRPTDSAARALLGPRASSVFPAPVRAALDAVSYQDASDRSFAVHGKRLSKQTFAILPKIREVDIALRCRPRDAERVREVHPEVSFSVLNNDEPMVHPKRTGLGFTERLTLSAPVIRFRLPRTGRGAVPAVPAPGAPLPPQAASVRARHSTDAERGRRTGFSGERKG